MDSTVSTRPPHSCKVPFCVLLSLVINHTQLARSCLPMNTNTRAYCIHVSTVPRQRLNKMRKTVGLSVIRLNSKIFYLLNKQGGVLEIVTSASAYILYDFKFKERYNLAWPLRSSQLSVYNYFYWDTSRR